MPQVEIGGRQTANDVNKSEPDCYGSGGVTRQEPLRKQPHRAAKSHNSYYKPPEVGAGPTTHTPPPSENGEDGGDGDDERGHQPPAESQIVSGSTCPLLFYILSIALVATLLLSSSPALQTHLKMSACKFVTEDALQIALKERLQPSVESAQNVAKLQRSLCRYYREHYSKINLTPWSDDNSTSAPVSDVYIRQTFHISNKDSEDLFDFFDWGSDTTTRSFLLEAEQGCNSINI